MYTYARRKRTRRKKKEKKRRSRARNTGGGTALRHCRNRRRDREGTSRVEERASLISRRLVARLGASEWPLTPLIPGVFQVAPRPLSARLDLLSKIRHRGSPSRRDTRFTAAAHWKTAGEPCAESRACLRLCPPSVPPPPLCLLSSGRDSSDIFSTGTWIIDT